MTIQERLSRRSQEDLIYVGELVERVCFKEDNQPTEFLQLLKALTEGRAENEAMMNKNGTSAERILGRIEMAYKLVNDLQQFVIDKDSAKAPRRRRSRQKPSPLAEEPSIPEPKIGGTI